MHCSQVQRAVWRSGTAAIQQVADLLATFQRAFQFVYFPAGPGNHTTGFRGESVFLDGSQNGFSLLIHRFETTNFRCRAVHQRMVIRLGIFAAVQIIYRNAFQNIHRQLAGFISRSVINL